MKPETATRTIDKELDNFLTGLYSPLQNVARKHIKSNEGRAAVPDLEISARRLESLYKKSKLNLDLEGILAKHGGSLTLEAANLITALIWLQRGNGSENPRTDYVEVGADRLFFAEDRKIEGITMTFTSGGEKSKLEAVHTKEEANVYAAFALEGKEVNSTLKTWRLESGILQIKGNRFKMVSAKGEFNSLSGQELSVEVQEEGGEVYARWDGNMRINNMLMHQKIELASLRGINSASGKIRLDMDYAPGGTGFQFMAVRKAEPWKPVELSRFASEKSIHGRGFFGVNLRRSETTESIEGVSVSVDNSAANRAPGTYLKIDEYTAEFGADGNVKSGKRRSKNFELKRMPLYVHTVAESNLTDEAQLERTAQMFGRVFEPVVSVISEAKAIEN